jgi:hypothetical protein
MSSRVISTFIILISVFISVSCSQSNQTELPATFKSAAYDGGMPIPEAVVKAFCDLDAKGKRISRSMLEQDKMFYQSLIQWSEEPVWNGAVIISGYRLGAIKKSQDSAEIAVNYHVQGHYSPDVIDIFEKREKITYQLVRTETGWKITAPINEPHVFPKTLVVKLEKNARSENDSSRKSKYQQDANLLKNIKYFNFTKKDLSYQHL